MTTNIKLLPCPFCGKSNQDRYPCEWLDGSGANVIRCAWCHGAAPASTWNRRTAPPSAPVGVGALLERIDAAIERVTSGRAEMRIPADPTDPDLVLADAGNWIKQAALAQQPAAVDGARVALAAANLLAILYPKRGRPAGPDRDAINELHSALAQQPAAVDGALSRDELDLCRQWFDSVQDTNGGYLSPPDYVLAAKLYRALGMRVPQSISRIAAQPGGSDNG